MDASKVDRSRGPALAAALVLAALVCLAMFEALFLDASILSLDNRIFAPLHYHNTVPSTTRPMNVLTTDINSYVVPDTLISLEQLAEGRVPLWNDRQLLGQPLMAAMGFSPFYPTAALYLVLQPLRALAVSIALHLLLLGFGTWMFLRNQGLGWLPSMLGASAVMFSGFATNHWHMPGFLMAYAWLPWLLLAGERLVQPTADRQGARRISVAGLTIGLCLLAGAPQISVLVITTAGLASLARWYAQRRTGQVAPARHALLAGVFAGGLGALLSAVLIAPSADIYATSARAQLVAETGLHSSDHLEAPALVGFALPRFFGDPVQNISSSGFDARRMDSFPSMQAWLSPDPQNNTIENNTWFGGLAFVLVLLAVPRMLSPARRFATALFSLSLAMALGLPILADLYRILPGIGIGSPKRLLCLTVFAGAWLAAASLHHIGKRQDHRSGKNLQIVGVLFLVAAALGFLPFESWAFPTAATPDQTWFREIVIRDLVLIAVVGTSLLVAGRLARRGHLTWTLVILTATAAAEGLYLSRAMNPPQGIKSQYAPTPVIEWLAERGARETTRIASFDDSTVLPGCLAQVFGIRSCGGYLPLASRSTREFFDALEPGIAGADGRSFGAIQRIDTLASPLLDLLGARFLVTGVHGYGQLGEKPPHGLRLAYLNDRERIAVYERPRSLPPAFLVSGVNVVPDRQDRLAALREPGFAPAQLALVEHAVKRDGELGSGTAVYKRVAADHIQVQVSCSGDGFLVLAETYATGWQADIDGVPTPIHRTNHALMGVAVPAGQTSVELHYRPAAFTWGAIASTLGLLTCLMLLAIRPRKSKPAPQTQDREQQGEQQP